MRAAGLNAGLHKALAPWRSPTVTHDPAKVPLDLAMTLALGGDSCSHLAMVRAQPAVDCPVAFGSTLSRVLAKLAGDVDKVLTAIDPNARHRPRPGLEGRRRSGS